ncbi:MAG: hypothetical protein H0X51_08810 [Parachlamydiaceae bacterium]|nr:hypothetical protein [Parachlamydiaceae bacterium]
MSLAHIIGFDSPEEITLLRNACILHFKDSESHSMIEVLEAANTFGLNFVPSPTFYRNIDQSNPEFLTRLVRAHWARTGMRLPDSYLSYEPSGLP